MRAVSHDSAHSETLLTVVISMQMHPCRCVFWTLRRDPRCLTQSEVCLYLFTQNCVGTQQSVCKTCCSCWHSTYSYVTVRFSVFTGGLWGFKGATLLRTRQWFWEGTEVYFSGTSVKTALNETLSVSRCLLSLPLGGQQLSLSLVWRRAVGRFKCVFKVCMRIFIMPAAGLPPPLTVDSVTFSLEGLDRRS